jgi:hypothetical protein
MCSRSSRCGEPSFASLTVAESEEPKPKDRPKALPIQALKLAPSVFQWRDVATSDGLDPDHLEELVRVLENTEAPLDALLVSAIGSSFYVVDGHHRLAAYHSVDWDRPIPVEYFEGDLDAAQAESLLRNSKNKLPMTHEDKLEAAWKLVRQATKSKKKIAALSTISESTVATMRRVLREYPQSQAEPWRVAKRLQWSSDDLPDDWLERKARKLARQWRKNLPRDFPKHSDVIARALAILDSDLPRHLIFEWHDLAADLVLEMELAENEFGL